MPDLVMDRRLSGDRSGVVSLEHHGVDVCSPQAADLAGDLTVGVGHFAQPVHQVNLTGGKDAFKRI